MMLWSFTKGLQNHCASIIASYYREDTWHFQERECEHNGCDALCRSAFPAQGVHGLWFWCKRGANSHPRAHSLPSQSLLISAWMLIRPALESSWEAVRASFTAFRETHDLTITQPIDLCVSGGYSFYLWSFCVHLRLDNMHNRLRLHCWWDHFLQFRRNSILIVSFSISRPHEISWPLQDVMWE